MDHAFVFSTGADQSAISDAYKIAQTLSALPMPQLASHEASQKPRRTKLADDGLDVGEIARVRTQRDGVANPTVAVCCGVIHVVWSIWQRLLLFPNCGHNRCVAVSDAMAVASVRSIAAATKPVGWHIPVRVRPVPVRTVVRVVVRGH